eukprot:16030_2
MTGHGGQHVPLTMECPVECGCDGRISPSSLFIALTSDCPVLHTTRHVPFHLGPNGSVTVLDQMESSLAWTSAGVSQSLK